VLLCFVMPTLVPWYFWGESIVTAYFLCALFRYCACLNATWCVNSFAHAWGWKPYDTRIMPSENPFVAFLALGEGFHNYHHTFPHDYSTTEFGWLLNMSTVFIDACAVFGLAYDRKSIPAKFVQMRREKTGDKVSSKTEKVQWTKLSWQLFCCDLHCMLVPVKRHSKCTCLANLVDVLDYINMLMCLVTWICYLSLVQIGPPSCV